MVLEMMMMIEMGTEMVMVMVKGLVMVMKTGLTMIGLKTASWSYR